MKEYGSSTTVFDLVFSDLTMGENTVSCPFHHEKTPSMQINTAQKIYHCFGCGAHGTENDFIAQYYSVDRGQTSTFKEILFKSDNIDDYENYNRSGREYASNYTYLELINLGVSKKVLEDLKVGSEVISKFDDDLAMPVISVDDKSHRLVFPIIIKDRVVDMRGYTTDKTLIPKTKSRAGIPTGMVLPYHLWIDDYSPTIVCEGEKDMAKARTYG